MEEVEEVEPSRGRGGEAELLMECDEEELEVFPQETEKEVKRETEGGHDRDETTKLAAEGPMEDARINKVPDQPESSRTVEKKLNNTHKDRKKGAPLGFKVNGRLISLQPGGSAAELKLCYHPRGSASGFTKVQVSIHPKVQVSTQPKVQVSTQPKVQVSTQPKVQVSTQPKVQVSTQPKVQVSTQPKVQVSTHPKVQVSTQPKVQVSTHPKVQKPAETDTDTASAQAGADLTPIITGVVSGEAAQRVLSDNRADIKPPLTEINSQPGSSSLAPQGPTPPNCLVCRSQYKFITKLRGFMCLCSPVIALSLKNLKKKKRRSSHRRSRDKNRISRSFRESHIIRPPGTLSRPGPSPQDQDQYGVSQSKLVILVEDFYYGSAPGQRKVNKEAQSWNRGPYHATHCQIPMQNNIELMNHMKLHITRPRVDRRRDSLTFCPHCFRHFPSPVSLQRHLEAVHSQCKSTALCKICELAFSSEVTFLSHMKNTHKPGEMPYTCQVCDFRSSFYADLWSHFELTHADSEHLLCPFCLRVMSSSTCYQQHVTRHQSKHVFGCDQCRLHFLYDKERIQHKLIHHRTHVKPVQLTGLKPGTKVTVRTYAEAPKKTSSSKAVDLELPPSRRGALKRTAVESLGRVLSTLSQESMSDGVSRPSALCVECMSPIQDFKTHFPSVVRCSVCSFLTCCCTAYANHMIRNHAVQTTAPQYANIFQSQPRLSEKLDCLLCMFSTYSGDMMANHLTERPQHGCAMLPNEEEPNEYSPKRQRIRGGTFIPLHLIPSSRQISDQLSVKFRKAPFSLSTPSAMSIRFLGPGLPPEQVRFSPLTCAQLSLVLAALCHGIPQASILHNTPPLTIRSWIRQQERGLSGSKWLWRTERLAEWVLSQREQQLQVSKDDMLRAARSALGDGSKQVDQLCWSVDFMLKHKLNFHPTNTDDFKHHRLALPRSLRERSCSFIQSLAEQIHSCPVPPHRFGAMDEFSIFIDPVLFSALSLSAFQLSGSTALDKPMFDVVLSALSDGTFLPPLLFFRGNPSPLPKGFPDNVLLEARQEGFTEQERHEIWINKVWSSCVASQCNSESLLMVDVHRGHLTDEFRSSLSSLTTDVVFIPSGCSCRLQPLDVCVTPVLRDFLQARWIQLVSDGGLDGLGLDQLALTLACWFSEVCFTLNTETRVLHRSFALACNLQEVEDRGEEARLIRILTEALSQPVETSKPPPKLDPGPELELLLVLEEEKNGTKKIQEKRRIKEERREEVLGNPSVRESVFKGESDQESFNRFD